MFIVSLCLRLLCRLFRHNYEELGLLVVNADGAENIAFIRCKQCDSVRHGL